MIFDTDSSSSSSSDSNDEVFDIDDEQNDMYFIFGVDYKSCNCTIIDKSEVDMECDEEDEIRLATDKHDFITGYYNNEEENKEIKNRYIYDLQCPVHRPKKEILDVMYY